MSEGDRAQDVGRSHKRRGAPAPETEELLERYRAAMRRELRGLLDELVPPAETVQQSIDGTGDRAIGLGLVARRERWELAIKLARELGGAIEPAWTGAPAPGAPPAGRGKVAPRLSARERRAIA